MNDAPLTPLPPDLEALLALERERPPLSEATQDRIFERCMTTVHRAPPRRVWPTALGSFALGLILGGGLVAALLWRGLAPIQPKVLMLEPPLPPSIAVVVVPARNIPPSPAPVPAPPMRRTLFGHGLASASATSGKDDRDTDLARERALLETARTALSHKQADTVPLLLRHAQQFPNGRLAEERESMLVQALVHAGRLDEARRRGTQFRARWPRSLLLPVVDAALRSIP